MRAGGTPHLLSNLFGPEGAGKSVFTAMIAAMASRGTLPGALERRPTNVEIIAYEDDPAAVLLPRLEAAGAHMTRIFIHDLEDEPLTLPDDVAAFRDHLRESGAKLVIIDPLTDALREGLKDNNNGDVRSALRPLLNMANEAGVAVLGITHPNKGAANPADKVMGSRAWRSVPRSVILYGHDPDDPAGDTRIAVVSKANYARRNAVKVRVTGVPVIVERREQRLPRAEIVGCSDYTDADVILANTGAKRPDGGMSKQQQAAALIYRLLEEAGSEIEAKAAYAAGEAAGISEPTMRRAREGIEGVSGGKVWKLSGLPI
jgi:hypothetical protein